MFVCCVVARAIFRGRSEFACVSSTLLSLSLAVVVLVPVGWVHSVLAAWHRTAVGASRTHFSLFMNHDSQTLADCSKV